MEGQPFVLDKRCERSFLELKERLTSTPMLVILEALGSFEVYSNPSNKWFKCVLMQDRKVVAYASKQIRPH